MHEDSRYRVCVYGPPASASRKASKKASKRKKTSGSTKKGSRRASPVRAKARKVSKRKGTRKTQPRSGKKVTGAKRQPTKKRTGRKSSTKKSARAAKVRKKSKSKSKRVSGPRKLPAKDKKSGAERRKASSTKSRTRGAKVRTRRKGVQPKSPRKRKSSVRAKPKKTAKRKAKAVSVQKVPPKAVKKPRVRGQTLRPEAPVVHERGQKLSTEVARRPGSVLIPHVLAPNVYYVDITKFEDYYEDDTDDEEEIERYTTSTAGMHPFNDNYLALFKQAFFDYTKKTRFEDMDDVPIFRYGLVVRSVRPRSGAEVKELVYKFAEFLKDMLPRGTSAHIVDEDRYISVRLGLGRYREPTTFSQAYEYMRRNKELIWNFKRGAMDYLDDMVWFEFWDTEENYAGSDP